MKEDISLKNYLKQFFCILIALCFLFSFPLVFPAQDFTIKLKSRQFEPVPEKKSIFETMKALKVERKHVLVQLYSIPTTEERTLIEAAGIRLFGYIPENGFFASLERRVGENDTLMKKIRWIGELSFQDRINPRIAGGNLGWWSRNEDGTVNIIVHFFPDVPVEEMQELLAKHGSIIYGPEVQDSSVIWVFRTSESSLNQLAHEDTIIWIEEMPPPSDTTNNGSRRAILVDSVHRNYNLHGANQTGSVMDGGFIHIAHPDFGARGVIAPFDAGNPQCKASTNQHATHVAGTFAGSGANSASTFKGMADQSSIRSYLWYPIIDSSAQCNLAKKVPEVGDSKTKYCNANQNSSNSANNSWGYVVKCDGVEPCNYRTNMGNCDLYGDYDAMCQLYDGLVRGTNAQCSEAKPLSIVFAAGNEQDDIDCKPNFSCSAPWDKNLNCSIDLSHASNWPYFTLLPPGGTAKNTIVVGATYSDNQTVTCFSSFGPTDDGRVKPDIVAPGDQNENGTCGSGLEIKSTWFPGVKYREMAGTSMAAPAVSGSALLLYEQYKITWNQTPLPSTIKALLINTAKDLGKTGPDFKYGYGLINERKAVDSIRNNTLMEGSVNLAQTVNQAINIPAGIQYFKVTLAWDDPPAAGGVAKELVNDLDLCMIPPGSVVCPDSGKPFILDPTNPDNAATQGVDDRNNVEQVMVKNPAAGNWTATIAGTAVPTAPQKFSLAWRIVAVNDEDGDGYTATDCDNDDPDVHPGANEICDGKDTDCVGGIPANELDNDGDGVMPCEGDCNDNDANIYPGNVDGAYIGIANCDGKNNDCDGLTDEGEPEICNDGVDNDCDGMTDMADIPDCLSMAQGPVEGFKFQANKISFSWNPKIDWTIYNVYRGELLALKDDNDDDMPDEGYGFCFINGTTTPGGDDYDIPEYPGGFIYLVTWENLSGEGTLGFTSTGVERQNLEVCSTPP